MSQPGDFRRGLHILIVLLALLAPLSAQQAPEDYSALRDKAFQLWEQGNQSAALPLLEKLAVLRPDDLVVLERLGAGLRASARFVEDSDERKKIVIRARNILLHAKELGDNSDYLNVMLEWAPENGEVSAFSTNTEVDKAMHKGEKAFGEANFAAALSAYELASQLDPQNYEAALFSGDVYFRKNQMDKADIWFSRAIQIDSNRETAYRYWGDGLLKEGKNDEARAKFIDAIVAEPYGKASWAGLRNWATANKATLGHPQIQNRASVSSEGNNVNITLDPSALGNKDKEEGVNWLIYSISRAAWRGETFKKEFPNEKTYRHTLREEAGALEAALPTIPENPKKAEKFRKKLDEEARILLKMKDSGLLDAFVLISRADQGIAQDYTAYRAEHRDKIVQYINEWIISIDPAKKQ
jgi:tetratricopeptide (TPR) repeat protein